GWTQKPDRAEHLAVYGADADSLHKLIAAQPDLAEKIHPAFPYQKAEVIWHAREEMAQTVEDVLARRTRALLLNAKASIDAAPAVAQILAAELNKDSAWIATQI